MTSTTASLTHATKQTTNRPNNQLIHAVECVSSDNTRTASADSYVHWWGFTAKQGATTIHEDRAAYTVSASSFTMEVVAVTYALRWIAPRCDSQTTHASILTDSMSLLQKVKSGMGSPDWNVSMVDIHLRKLLWVYCSGHAGVKGNDRADRLTGKATLASGLLLGRPEVLRSLRHYLRAQSQGHHTTDRLEERGVERGNARRSSLKGRERAIVNQTNIETVSKTTLGETSERRSGAHMGFSESIDNILN